MAEVRDIPTAKQVTEAELVNEFAETAAIHGYKITTFRVTVDREAGTTGLTINGIKGSPEQGVLPLRERQRGRKAGEDDEGGGQE